MKAEGPGQRVGLGYFPGKLSNTHQRIRNTSRPRSENRGRIDKCPPGISIVM